MPTVRDPFRTATGGRRLLAGAAITLLLAGCSSSGPSPGEAENTIRSSHLSDRQAVIAIDGLLNTQSGSTASRKLLDQGATGDTRWFALYVYANSGTDPAPLRPLLNDADPTVRVVAAAGLVTLGDVSGFPVLVDALTHTETLPASDPPTPAWMVATQTLARSIGDPTMGPPFDANAFQRTVARDRWKEWLASHSGKLHFDAASGEWSVG